MAAMERKKERKGRKGESLAKKEEKGQPAHTPTYIGWLAAMQWWEWGGARGA